MRVGDTHFRTIWPSPGLDTVEIIDQTRLPHEFAIAQLRDVNETAHAITTMMVRGAPLIGATAAYGICLAMNADPSDAHLEQASRILLATRPTAVNLRWAIEEMRSTLATVPTHSRRTLAWSRAAEICEEDVATNRAIGDNGLALILKAQQAKHPATPVNILTHCNAGWLATVDWGTALAPVYRAFDAGIPLHVWVDETRPRNQGASLTAWELASHGIPHTIIADNAGGHLMQRGQVDLCIVGTDRTTRTGDVCNKIGTYLKALAAREHSVPFYVALPSPTIDWRVRDGIAEIPIEERDGREVSTIGGRTATGEVVSVQLAPAGSRAANPAFDVTPARLVTALITERGVCEASEPGLATLYPERAGQPN